VQDLGGTSSEERRWNKRNIETIWGSSVINAINAGIIRFKNLRNHPWKRLPCQWVRAKRIRYQYTQKRKQGRCWEKVIRV
jgi:hypothetical protein